MAKICHFVKKHNSKATWSKELFGNFPKELSHFKEESYEIAKIFVGFGQISSFLLLPYVANRFQ
jgi:hypothetical protein